MTTFELLDAAGVVAGALGSHPSVNHLERLADDRYCFEFDTADGRTLVAEVTVHLVDVQDGPLF